MGNEVFSHLLFKLAIHPVLIDIGASGAPPEIWEKIARYSIYVGFDPDLREIQEVQEGHFYKSIIINEAITDEKENHEVPFYLTRFPHCSSTLKPDVASLSNFLFSDLFIVEKETTVRATTLNSVMNRLSLSYIDWIKIDSQGTDLRIFKSLKEEVCSRVLAVDIEPGLIDAYIGGFVCRCA
jgi:FkbM family methyltransferase